MDVGWRRVGAPERLADAASRGARARPFLAGGSGTPRISPSSHRFDRPQGLPDGLGYKFAIAILGIIGTLGIGVFVTGLVQNTADQDRATQRTLDAFDAALAANPIFSALAKSDLADYRGFLDHEHRILRQRPDDTDLLIRTDGITFAQSEIKRHLRTATPATMKAWGRLQLDLYQSWYAESPDGLFDALTTDGTGGVLPRDIAATLSDPTSSENRLAVDVIVAPPAAHAVVFAAPTQSMVSRLAASLPSNQIQALHDHDSGRAVDKATYVQAILGLYSKALDLPDEEAAAFLQSIGSGRTAR